MAQRRRAADGWSRLVGTLKVALPLTALGLLSTLFLVSNRIDPEQAIPYATVDVAARMREPRLTMPAYAGTTADGSALTMQAAEARPATTPEAASTAADIAASLTTPDGKRTDITSATAVIDPVTNQLRLTGDVQLDHSTGYRVTTQALTADLTETALVSDTPVAATGPIGDLTADSMSLTRSASGGETYLLVFKGRVKLVYQPK